MEILLCFFSWDSTKTALGLPVSRHHLQSSDSFAPPKNVQGPFFIRLPSRIQWNPSLCGTLLETQYLCEYFHSKLQWETFNRFWKEPSFLPPNQCKTTRPTRVTFHPLEFAMLFPNLPRFFFLEDALLDALPGLNSWSWYRPNSYRGAYSGLNIWKGDTPSLRTIIALGDNWNKTRLALTEKQTIARVRGL